MEQLFYGFSTKLDVTYFSWSGQKELGFSSVSDLLYCADLISIKV